MLNKRYTYNRIFLRFLRPFSKILLPSLCAFFVHISWAESQFGASVGYAGGSFDLDNASQAQGIRVTLDDHLLSDHQWHNFELFLQASTAYYQSDYEPLEPPHGDNLWVFTLAPVIRYHFLPQASIDPFMDFSSGPGYLSTIYYENRNLGLHFTLQNMVGIGASFGEDHRFALEASMFHYSNAGMSDHNRGLTSPLTISMSYMF